MKTAEALMLTGELLEGEMDFLEDFREDGGEVDEHLIRRTEALRITLDMARKFHEQNEEERKSRKRLKYVENDRRILNLIETSADSLLSEFIFDNFGKMHDNTLIGYFVDRGQGPLEDVEQLLYKNSYKSLFDTFNREKIKEYTFYTINREDE